MVINSKFLYNPNKLEIFRNRKPKPLGTFRRSSVLILLVEKDGEDHIVLEKRAAGLKSQPGDISFPGGRIEDGETEVRAALRETMEEIGLPEGEIDLLGPMDFFISPFNTIIFPFVGKTDRIEFDPSPGEVAEILLVPIRFFIDNPPKVHYLKLGTFPDGDFPYDLIVNGRNYNFSSSDYPQLFWVWQGHTIWGFTARILNEFLHIMDVESI